MAGCSSYPADPEGSLDQARGGELSVGVVEHRPWTDLSGGAHIRDAVRDLADARATTVDNSAPHPLIAQINERILEEPQVVSVQTRARDQGHVLHVEAFLQTRGGQVTTEWLEELRHSCAEMDWRIQDMVLSVTARPHGEGDDAHGEQERG